MINAILVPNRGEIPVRIARACREMGIRSILGHAANDDVRFVRRFFDDAVPLKSYLDVASAIDAAAAAGGIAAARAPGAGAIQPGCGCLSERAELAAACEEAKIVFIGSTAESIAAMGSKAHSRHLMQRLGVPVVPGYDGEDQTNLQAEAERIGVPVLVKASAGGGGKGMKIVRERGELQSQIESARREAMKAFGDDRLLLAKHNE